MNTDQESAMRFNTLLERLQMSIFSLADSFVNQNSSLTNSALLAQCDAAKAYCFHPA